MGYPQEHVFPLADAVQAAGELLAERQPDGCTLIGFTMRLGEHPSERFIVEMVRLAQTFGFSFHVQESVRRRNADGEVEYRYTPTYFVSESPGR